MGHYLTLRPRQMALDFSDRNWLPGQQLTSLLSPKPAQPWAAPSSLLVLCPQPPSGKSHGPLWGGVKSRYGDSRRFFDGC